MSDPGAGVDLVDAGVQAAGAGGGFAAVLLSVRWFLNWVAGRVDRRQTLLDAQEARADLEWQKIREDLKGELATIRRQNAALRIAFHHVGAALVRVDPLNPALIQAEQIMAQAFPLDLTLITEMAEAAIERTTQAKD